MPKSLRIFYAISITFLLLASLSIAACPAHGQEKKCTQCPCGKTANDCVILCADDGKKMPADCVKACVKKDNGILCMRENQTPPDLKISVDLTHKYEEINDSYFFGKLPKDLIVYFSSAGGNMGLTTPVGSSFRIEINGRLNPTEKEQYVTLYHEVCHVSTWGKDFDEHGPRWLGCMHYLMNSGAFDDLL